MPSCRGPWVLYGFGTKGFCKNECDLKKQKRYYLVLNKDESFTPGIHNITGIYMPTVKERSKTDAFHNLERIHEVWEAHLIKDNSDSEYTPHIFNLLRKLTGPTD